ELNRKAQGTQTVSVFLSVEFLAFRAPTDTSGVSPIATATTAATTTPAAAGALFAGTGDIDREGAAIQLRPIQGSNRFLRFSLIAHGHESESTGFVGDAIHHEIDLGHRAMRGKGVLKVVFGDVKGEIPDKQFIVHMIQDRQTPQVPDCSRTPGLES